MKSFLLVFFGVRRQRKDGIMWKTTSSSSSTFTKSVLINNNNNGFFIHVKNERSREDARVALVLCNLIAM